MVEIIKVYKESFPSLRLIGKCYGNNDRDEYGSFSRKWGEWFEKGYFSTLEELGSLRTIPGLLNATIALVSPHLMKMARLF